MLEKILGVVQTVLVCNAILLLAGSLAMYRLTWLYWPEDIACWLLYVTAAVSGGCSLLIAGFLAVTTAAKYWPTKN